MMIGKRVVKWNEDRGLIPENPSMFNQEVAALNLGEELVEFLFDVDSKKARKVAFELKSKTIELCMGRLAGTTPEQKINALCDIVTLALGDIGKLGYDPDICMDETLKEIESRDGSVINGKFEKDLSKQGDWYAPDYNKARIKK